MSTTLEILEQGDLAKRIAESEQSQRKCREKFLPPETLKILFTTGDNHERDGGCEQAYYIREALRLARLQLAIGTSAGPIRENLKDAVRLFAEVVPHYNYSAFNMKFAVHKSQAAKYDGQEIPHDLGNVFLAPSPSLGNDYQTVTVKVKRQPAQFEMKEALMVALIAHDFETAHSIASAYHLQPAITGASASHLGVLREAILDRTEPALQHLENIYDGYSPDFPPDRREVAEGVIRRDPALIKKGLKAATTRFKTAWKLKTYCTPAKLKRFGSVEKMLPKIRSHLINHHWLMSDWVIAWMSLAAHRGLNEAFSEPDLFCEWIPWELCCESPNPAINATTIAKPKKVSAKPGKRALQEALQKAIEADDAEEVERALTAGADPEAKDLGKRTALLVAAVNGKTKAVRALMARKVNLEAEDPQRRTALSWAAEKGHSAIVEMLLQAGIPAEGSNSPATHLIYAAMGGHLECARLLIAAGANPNRPEHRRLHTPITIAAGLNHEAMVDLLIKAGADVNEPRGSFRAAILLTAKNGNTNILNALIAAGAELNNLGGHGTPLHEAAGKHHADAALLLLTAGAKVDAKDQMQETPLHKAASAWDVKANFGSIAKILIDAGAHVNAQCDLGYTPLMKAIGWPDRMKLLIAAGADLSLKTEKGQTALELAQTHAQSQELLANFSRV